MVLITHIHLLLFILNMRDILGEGITLENIKWMFIGGDKTERRTDTHFNSDLF